MFQVLLWYDSADTETMIDLDVKVELLAERFTNPLENHDFELDHARNKWINVRERNNSNSIFLPYYMRLLCFILTKVRLGSSVF